MVKDAFDGNDVRDLRCRVERLEAVLQVVREACCIFVEQTAPESMPLELKVAAWRESVRLLWTRLGR